MVYDVNNDPYLDKTSGILKNKLSKLTHEDLTSAEAQLTTTKITTIINETLPLQQPISAILFLNIHKSIFGDIYDWAGCLRTVELQKGATSFARSAHLAASLGDIFRQLEADNFLIGYSHDDFARKLASYYADFIVLHPFREGNGRAVRTFLAILAANAGWHIAWDKMDPQTNINASIAAYNGEETPL